MILFLDVLACFFIAIMGSIGFRRGFIEEIGRLIGLLVSTLFSLKYYLLLSAKILSTVVFILLSTFLKALSRLDNSLSIPFSVSFF